MQVYNQTQEDKKPINWLSLWITLGAIAIIVSCFAYIDKLRDQDKRIEYIESVHSEIKR